MAILDTSFVIDLLRRYPHVKELLFELDTTESSLRIVAPSVMELWTGALLSMHTVEQMKVKRLLQSLEIVPFTEQGALEAAEIEFELRKKGLPIETEDVMIAGISRHLGEKIVTRDQHYSRISNLKVLKY